ncbi:MAG: DNA polymerase III subunit beta [Acidobacteriota bacterium]
MEFTIKQSVLKEELGFIQGVVERKTTIPVLSNLLIESIGEKEVRIVGTDLDVTIRCDAEADIKTAGSMCIQARKLFDIVRALPAGADAHFKKEENEWVVLKCGNARFRLAGVNREQFPEIPQFKSTPLRLPAETFAYFIQNTAFAITNEQSRFTLSGAKFIIGDGKARMVTTDGHRLAYVEKAVETDGTMDTLVPKKALLELVKLARGGDSDIAFGEDANHIFFETEGRLLITRKLSGNFPNYEMVMPKDSDHFAIFDLDDMRSAVRRVSLMADERNRSIRLTVREGEVEITAQSSEEGEGREIVPADYKGEEMTLGFNWQYLLEFLSNVGSNEVAAVATDSDGASGEATKETDGDKVRVRETAGPTRISFEFKDPNAQTQMRIAGDTAYDYKYIVMPLRI